MEDNPHESPIINPHLAEVLSAALSCEHSKKLLQHHQTQVHQNARKQKPIMVMASFRQLWWEVGPTSGLRFRGKHG